MKKTFVLGAVLSLASVVFAGQKSYDVIFAAPTTVAGVKLAPGQYAVKVDGSNAVFTNSQTAKSVSAPVKVETVTKKYSYTAVDTTKEGDGEKVNAIELGGTSTKLEFTK